MSNKESKIAKLRKAYDAKFKGRDPRLITLLTEDSQKILPKGKDFIVTLEGGIHVISGNTQFIDRLKANSSFAWTKFYEAVEANNVIKPKEEAATAAKTPSLNDLLKSAAGMEAIDDDVKPASPAIAVLRVFDLADLTLIDGRIWTETGRQEAYKPTHSVNLSRTDRPTSRTFYFRLDKQFDVLTELNEKIDINAFNAEVNRVAAELLNFAGFTIFTRGYSVATHDFQVDIIDSLSMSNILGRSLRRMATGIELEYSKLGTGKSKPAEGKKLNAAGEEVHTDVKLKPFGVTTLNWPGRAIGVNVDDENNDILVSVGHFNFNGGLDGGSVLVADITFGPGTSNVKYTVTCGTHAVGTDVTLMTINDFELAEVERRVTELLRNELSFQVADGMVLNLKEAEFKFRRDTLIGK